MATANINQLALYIQNNEGATVKDAEKRFNVELTKEQKEELNRQLEAYQEQKEEEQQEEKEAADNGGQE